jgi:hypothetical protein
MPIVRSVLAIRTAISPRLAISTDSNMCRAFKHKHDERCSSDHPATFDGNHFVVAPTAPAARSIHLAVRMEYFYDHPPSAFRALAFHPVGQLPRDKLFNRVAEESKVGHSNQSIGHSLISCAALER